MQEYVNIDYKKTVSIVAELKNGKLIGEARFISLEIHETHPEIAIIVDENYQNLGIATYILTMLMKLAKEKKLKGFKGYILPDNRKILRVIKKIDWEVELKIEKDQYNLILYF